MALQNNRWLGDRGDDNSAIFVNNAGGCADFDGAAGYNTNLGGEYCCLEWMKY